MYYLYMIKRYKYNMMQAQFEEKPEVKRHLKPLFVIRRRGMEWFDGLFDLDQV